MGGGMGVWVGLQKLIPDLDMRNGDKGGVRVGFIVSYSGGHVLRQTDSLSLS